MNTFYLLCYIIYTSGFDSVLYTRISPTWLYRIIQKVLEGLGLAVLVWLSHSWWMLLPALLCHYAMVMDRLYYEWRGEDSDLDKFQRGGIDVFWLKRWYFSGWWLFKNRFTVKRLNWSAVVGLAAAVILSFFI